MSYSGIASSRLDIKGIFAADYYYGSDRVLLKVNKTILVGSYPTLNAAREALNGLLVKAGSNNPYGMSFRFPETVTYLTTIPTTNSQTGNTLTTMYSTTASSGIVDTSNASYIDIKTDVAGTYNSRARVINESDAYAALSADVWKAYLYKTSIYSSRAEVLSFNNSLWNVNSAVIGFHGNHVNADLTKYNVEKGCVFTPNALGNWRCRWFQSMADSPFKEVLYRDTNYPITTPQNLSIIIEDYGKSATWLINNTIQFSVHYTDSPQFNPLLLPSNQEIKSVIYSGQTESADPEGSLPNNGYAAYVGSEVRRRSAGSAQYSIRLYNQSLKTI